MRATREDIRIVEALIFASEEPITVKELVNLTGDLLTCFVEEAIESYSDWLDKSQSALKLQRVAGGFQLVTRKGLVSVVRKLRINESKMRLSQAALETLAIIAYRQPVSRVNIQSVRGVNSDGVLRGLIDRKLVKISGRSKALGRPLLYGTTTNFLQYFGLNDVSELPKSDEIKELSKTGKTIEIDEEMDAFE